MKKKEATQFDLLKINIDENPAVAEKFRIKSVPTIILFKNGEQLWRHAGLLTKRDLLDTIVQKTRQAHL